jgi:membrane protein
MTENYQDNWITRVENWLWRAELAEKSVVTRRLWHAGRVAFAVIRDIIDGHITLYAMSLVYTTLLSIVPFLALSFSVLKGFGVHNQLEPILESLLVAPLGPEKGQVIVENILSFVDNVKVGVLGSVGLALLVYTVISLVQKIEYSFNEIWCISRSRSWSQRFSNYLSVIVIGPVLIFSALGTTAAIVNTDIVKHVVEIEQLAWLFELIGRLVPFIMIIALFTFLYIFIPNTKVKIRYALAGGTVAGVIWQTAGFVFTFFAAGSGKYDAIYSGFAVGIMFLIWLYLAWLILLIGASVAYYAQHARQISRSRVVAPSAALDEYAGLALFYRVAKHFDEHGGSCSVTTIEADIAVGGETLKRVIRRLVRHKLLVFSGTEEDELLPARSLDKITLSQLIHVLRLPEQPLPVSYTVQDEVESVVDTIDKAFVSALGDTTVADWVRKTAALPGSLA